MKLRFTLQSAGVFSIFSFLGPFIQRSPLPPFLSMHREDLVIMFWPAIFLSSGGSPYNSHDFWMCLVANVVLFILLGLFIGLLGGHRGAVFGLYIGLCALLTLVEAWGSGFSLAFFSWRVLAFAFFLYWLPFWFLLGVSKHWTLAMKETPA